MGTKAIKFVYKIMEKNESLDIGGLTFLIPPWKHQLAALSKAKDLPEYGLLFEVGTGKTSTAINIIRSKMNSEGRFLKTLILGPPIIIKNWVKELGMHSKIEPRQIMPLYGSGAKRLKEFTEATKADPKRVVITNYETLSMSELYSALVLWKPEIVIYDESHMLKDPRAARSKLALTFSENARYRYILTGTPVLNSPLDLFHQFRLLDNGQTFGHNFFLFRARFFVDKNANMPKQKYFPNWQIAPGALGKINSMISAKTMRALKKDCLDLPPLVRETRYVSMTVEQSRLYREMKQELVTYLGDKACVATMALTKALRLMQLASGYIKVTDGEEIALEETPKQLVLKQLLQELTPNHKVIVWATWKQNYEQIAEVCEELGIAYTEIHGGVSGTEKFNNMDTFNDDPKCRVLIGHPGSGGVGVNLIQASYCIFYSRNFSLGHSLQAEARCHRGGSEIHEKITRIDLVTENTIDEAIVKRLLAKKEVSDALLGDEDSIMTKQLLMELKDEI